MKKLIINADDFGYCEAVNYGILKAYQCGLIKSTTIMANMPGFDHAVALAKENPGLDIGVHMTLTCYKPLLSAHKTMTKDDGMFDQKNKENFDLKEVYEELVAQIEKVKKAGIKITHLDSHHHVHTNPIYKDVIERIANEYKLPMRGGFKYDIDYKKCTELCGKFYMKNVNVSYLDEFFGEMEDGKIYDMMCHPAYLDQFLYNSSSYALQRMDELAILISDEVKDLVKKHNVEITSYRKEFFE